MLNKVKVEFTNTKHLDNALTNIIDVHGRKWKGSAFRRAGKRAFKHVVNLAKRLAPKGETGLTSSTLWYTQRFIANPSGKSKKFQNEYSIATTYGRAFNAQAPRSSRGRILRYPFMNEVGVPPQTYTQQRKNGLTRVSRKAPRNPLAFQHMALYRRATRVRDLFIAQLNKDIQKRVVIDERKAKRIAKKKKV